MANLDNFRLVVFRAVAEHLSFRRAAEELFLTQPAVSHQIKALEDDLGVLLFDRTGNQAKLTNAGKVLQNYASQSSALLTEAEREIGALHGNFSGELKLGASTTIAQYVLPRLLGEFCRTYPRVQPSLISGNTEQIVQAVESRQIELGFLEGPPRNRNIKTEAFLRDELVLIAPIAYEWVERDRVSAAALTDFALLMREPGSGTRRVVELALEKNGIKRRTLKTVMELDSTEAIKSAVEAGLGAGFVSRWAISKDARLESSFKIIEIEDLQIQRDFLIAEIKGPEHASLAQEFKRFIFARTGGTALASKMR